MQKEQKIITDFNNMDDVLHINELGNILVVCPEFMLTSSFLNGLREKNPNIYTFTNFSPNPKYEEVLDGISVFKQNECNSIISIGGGSAIDVAKTIKAFVGLNENENYLNQQIVDNNVKLMAIPTTAGTGSESTSFAVIYFEGNKYSIDSRYILPDYVLLEPSFLEGLPLYQKKSTMLDAFCQGIESFWSVNSTNESREYAMKAIKLILNNYKDYIQENSSVYPFIMEAANYSGRAINISKTTAAHAMSYKITSLYGVSHGHAVAMCLPHIWEYMINNINLSVDPRGIDYLEGVFHQLDLTFESDSHEETLSKLNMVLNDVGLDYSGIVKEDDLELLTSSVNVQRLKNNPVSLDSVIIEKVYRKLM